jgi:hypothetical protein
MATDQELLRQRTQGRNAAIWTNFDQAGLAALLAGHEALINVAYQDFAKMGTDLIDGLVDHKAAQRDKLNDLELEKVAQDRGLALAKVTAQRQALAIKRAGEEYFLSIREYAARVDALIMAAKEYAAEIEREQVELQAARARMDVRKAEVQLQEINTRIALELVDRAYIEADVAKTKVEVAKANVRVIMAGIEASEAELAEVKARVEKAMTEAERAALNAQVAQIYADIIARGLTAIRLGVEQEDIKAAYGFVQQHLSDLLATWQTRAMLEEMRTQYEGRYKQEAETLSGLQKNLEALQLAKAQNEAEVWSGTEKPTTSANLTQELLHLGHKVNAGEGALTAESLGKRAVVNAQATAKGVVNAAKEATYAAMEYHDAYESKIRQVISRDEGQ